MQDEAGSKNGNRPGSLDKPAYEFGYRVASGLLWQDRLALLLAYWILVLPQILDLVDLSFLGLPAYSLIGLERVSQLIFLAWLTGRWIKRLRRNKIGLSSRPVVSFFIIGFLTWSALIIPLLLQFTAAPAGVKSLSFVMLIPLVVLINRYFFYFFPLLCGIHPLKETLESSQSINAPDQLMSLRTFAAPIGIFSLLIAVIMAFSPDGRDLWVNILAAVASGFFWFLHCYLALAFALVYWNDRDWHRAGLDPYRQARLQTISLAGPVYLSKIIGARRGVIAIICSLLVWSANLMRLETTPPAAQINLESAEVSKDLVTLKLHLSDPDYGFRGFQPIHFHLAGEQGAPVSSKMESAKINGETDDAFFVIPGDLNQTELTLSFRANRSGTALAKLEDLHLWYRHAKIMKLDLSKAKVSN